MLPLFNNFSMKRKKERHLIVRSRNTTCKALKELIVPRTTILRLGSTTPTEQITRRPNPVEINTAEACAISSDKILMKRAFDSHDIPSAEWKVYDKGEEITENKILDLFEAFDCRVIVKHKHSSKGDGIFYFTSAEDLGVWMAEHQDVIHNYVFERYYTYTREYRLHVTKHGCFYACRKMLKRDAEVRWHRHNTNSVWIVEENPLFDKPVNWDSIVDSCVSALDAIGLDIAAFDVKVQSNKHEEPKYIILESNSAPSLGERGIEKYKEILTRLINEQEFPDA